MRIMDERAWADLLARLSGPGVVAPEDRLQLLDEALSLGSTISADGLGCSVTQKMDEIYSTPAASTDLARQLDQAQYAIQDGPCVTACREGRPRGIADTGADSEFGSFGKHAAQLGVRSVLSLPVREIRRPTALNFYAGSTSAFETATVQASARLLANCVAAAVRGADTDVVGVSAADVAAARRSGATVLAARRVLADERGLSDGEAYDVMIQQAGRERRKLFDVSSDILSHEQHRQRS